MKYFISILSFLVAMACQAQDAGLFKIREVYKSRHLIIRQVAPHSYQHISFLQTNDFGNVPCNGLIVSNGNEAAVFDTPTNDSGSTELIKWIRDVIQCKLIAVVPTHFHNDCLGGLRIFHSANVPSYAYKRTIELAKLNNYEIPSNGFTDSVRLKIGNEFAIARFFGEGHTRDNVVGYFPLDKVLFGGCLIKEIDASKGYLGDANVSDWSATVRKVRNHFSDVKIVVPGHGDIGGKQLLDYTIGLFEQK